MSNSTDFVSQERDRLFDRYQKATEALHAAKSKFQLESGLFVSRPSASNYQRLTDAAIAYQDATNEFNEAEEALISWDKANPL